MAVLDFVKNINEAIDNNKYTDSIFMDLSKAFVLSTTIFCYTNNTIMVFGEYPKHITKNKSPPEDFIITS